MALVGDRTAYDRQIFHHVGREWQRQEAIAQLGRGLEVVVLKRGDRGLEFRLNVLLGSEGQCCEWREWREW